MNKLDLFFRGSLSLAGIACALILAPLTAQSAEQQEYETEAQRLERVRTIISQEKSRRLKERQYLQVNSTAPSCEVMLDDLLSNRGFEPLEPVAVFNHNYPLRSPFLEERLPLEEEQQAQAAEEKMGSFLANSLQKCAKVQAEGDEERARTLFNAFNYAAGAPPFRVYQLPEGVNPFPESKLIYWSEYLRESNKGRKGYSWVDLDSCEHTWGISGLTDSSSLEKDPHGQVGVLTVYEGRLVSWVVSRGFRFEAGYYDYYYPGNVKAGASCAWVTYPEHLKKITD